MERATSALLLVCVAAFAQQQGTFTDSRDGKRYKTVKIGEQVWMAENLDYNASSSKCYDNQSANCNKYGRLYNWNTALKACPSDWHLPSDEEWWTIRTNVGSVTKLKAKNGWNKNGNGTDEFGFSALPGGFGIPDGSFFGTVGNLGCWWSATKSKSNNDNTYGRCVGYDGTDEGFEDSKATTLSIRCVQNKAIIEAKEAANAAVQEGSFTDPRDGKTYKTVKIGEQTWMAENLNYGASSSVCYDKNENNCQKYGRFYNWNTALKACPSDWHLPSGKEWNELMTAAGGDNVAGKKLRAKSGWNDDGNGTDDYGFAALPGGQGNSSGRFSSIGNFGYWWSATESSTSHIYTMNMDLNRERLRWDDDDKSNLANVRCVQDLGSGGSAIGTATPATSSPIADSNACNTETNKTKQIFERCKKIGKGRSDYGKCAEEYNTQRGKAQQACRIGTVSSEQTEFEKLVQWCAERDNNVKKYPQCGKLKHQEGKIEGTALIDKRDGKTYKTVKIGEQTWMAENLDYNASGSKCYGNETANCSKYGKLYKWNTALKVCPSGWHLPTKEEWNVLITTAGGEKIACKKLKAKSGWDDYNGKSGNGTDEFSFSALPGGGHVGGIFYGVGNQVYLWSASKKYSSGFAFSQFVNCYDETRRYDEISWGDGTESDLFSVRCVQD